MQSFSRLVVVGVAFLVIGCENTSVTPVSVASVLITPETLELEVGATGSLSATLKDAEGNELTGRTITWSSSNQAVAMVSSDGVVTAEAEGEATITATSEGQSGTATVQVLPVPVASVEVTPETLELEEGATGSLSVTLKDSDGNVLTDRAVSWTSSDQAVATVSSGGVVTAKAKGEATITATSEGQSGSTIVQVTGYTQVSGIIDSDATWTSSNSPYEFTGTVQLAQGATLRIDPDVRVLGHSETLEVWGNLRVEGTSANPIKLDSLTIEGYSTIKSGSLCNSAPPVGA